MKKMAFALGMAAVALGGGGMAVVTLGGAGAGAGPAAAASHQVVVYKSPLCGCCGDWVTYMEKHGYRVEVHETEAVQEVKARLGVPEDMYSCHTAIIGDYVIEGHVPVEAIDKLFAERPKVTGIASPGMPQGSPGMGGAKEPNVIVTFGGKVPTTVFGTY